MELRSLTPVFDGRAERRARPALHGLACSGMPIGPGSFLVLTDVDRLHVSASRRVRRTAPAALPRSANPRTHSWQAGRASLEKRLAIQRGACLSICRLRGGVGSTLERSSVGPRGARLPAGVTIGRALWLSESGRAKHGGAGATTPSNKELKLTKPGTIGASQLNSSVRWTRWRCHRTDSLARRRG